MISVLSVISNKETAKQYLLKGLSNQDTRFQLILLDNTGSKYRSASQAYNFGITKATGEYIIFIHQDVFLPYSNWLREAEDSLCSLSELGLAGVAGMLKPRFLNQYELYMRYYSLRKLGLLRLWFQRYGRGNLFHGPEKAVWMGKQIAEAVPVQTLDELILMVPCKILKQISFDEMTCSDWHFYGVDYSLTASRQGYKVYVLPLKAYHASLGKADRSYYSTLIKINCKHRQERVINTTIGPMPTDPALTSLMIDLINRSAGLKEHFVRDLTG